ncbi:MAG: nitroreductase [Thioalkalispiraceae bacterium]|jgi:nitroreductase
MDTIDAIKSRHATRGFLSTPVETPLIEKILDAARYAPSGVNTQPWKVAVVRGQVQQQLSEQLIAAKEQKQPANPDYAYYPDRWSEPYKSRRKSCGLALYSALQIEKGDFGKQKQAWYNNYRFFNAPVGLLFFIDKQLNQGSWIDMGMFLQNIMLAATDYGLATCPQASLAEYPDIVRGLLNISEDYAVVCGMALGYEDPDHPANSFRLEREPVDSFTTWFE